MAFSNAANPDAISFQFGEDLSFFGDGFGVFWPDIYGKF